MSGSLLPKKLPPSTKKIALSFDFDDSAFRENQNNSDSFIAEEINEFEPDETIAEMNSEQLEGILSKEPSKKKSGTQKLDPKNLRPGDSISDYQIVKKLGQGGMGTVFQCFDSVLQRHIAVKLLRNEYSSHSNFRIRFETEARAIAQLRHPNIIQVFRAGEDPKTHNLFFAMDLVEGEGLEELISRKKRLLPQKALKYLQQVAEGLKYSHEKNIIHRDIKPANILISKDDQAMIADFGLAKMVDSGEIVASETNPSAPLLQNVHLTQFGTVIGTPLYMAPERIDGVNNDPRSDIYALGMVFYVCLTGKAPFDKEKVAQILKAQKQQEPEPIEYFASDCPPVLIQIFKKATAKKREDRFQSMEELLRSIENIEKNKQQERDLYEKRKLAAIAVSSLEKEKKTSHAWIKYLFMGVPLFFGSVLFFYQFMKAPILQKNHSKPVVLSTRAREQHWIHQQETRLAGCFVQQETTSNGAIRIKISTHFDGIQWNEEKWIEFTKQEWDSILEEYKLSLEPGDYVAFTGEAVVRNQKIAYLDGHFQSFLRIDSIRRMRRKKGNIIPERIKKFSEKLVGETVQVIGRILFIEETPENGVNLLMVGTHQEKLWIKLSKKTLEQIERRQYSPRSGDLIHVIGTLFTKPNKNQEETVFLIELDENRLDNCSLAQ